MKLVRAGDPPPAAPENHFTGKADPHHRLDEQRLAGEPSGIDIMGNRCSTSSAGTGGSKRRTRTVCRFSEATSFMLHQARSIGMGLKQVRASSILR
jgi:hypothetical protein